MTLQDLCISALRIRVVGHNEFLGALFHNLNTCHVTHSDNMKVNYTLVIRLLQYRPRSDSLRLYPFLFQSKSPILETSVLSDVDKTSDSIRVRPQL